MPPDGSSPFLYPIVDTGVCHARALEPLALATAFFKGGARLVQLRHKEHGSAAFLSLPDAIVARARDYGARVVINDRADIASLSAAAGVHVGQDDLLVADARRVVGDEVIVGVSTHESAQIDEASRTSATYVAVGPVFGTTTKDTGYAARGLALVTYAAARGKPVVAIGGITLDNARSAIDAGARGLAVITDLLKRNRNDWE